MGRNQRLRKEQRLEEKINIQEAIRQRGKERFWRQAMPIVKLGIVLLATLSLVWTSKLLLDRVAVMAKKPRSEVMKTAVIKTDKGDIKIKFYQDDAPRTVENFTLLAGRGYYNGTTFHRVEPGFVIQGGDPLSKDDDPSNDGTGGESAWGGKFADELNSKTESYKKGYVTGTVAMANSGENTNGSQFFIVLEDQPSLPKKYSIFGYVTEGMEVVKNIAKGDVMKQVIIEETSGGDL